MKIAGETKTRWMEINNHCPDKVTLREVLKTGRQVQDSMDQIGVSSENALISAISYVACMFLLFLVIFGSLAMRAIQ